MLLSSFKGIPRYFKINYNSGNRCFSQQNSHGTKPNQLEGVNMPDDRERLDQAIRNTTIQAGKYLTFILGKEAYGIGILKVKEIIGMMPITSVPRTPDFVKGVINLRGKVIPVIELRSKFEMVSIPYSDRTCIIVVEVDSDDATVLVGIVVDSVSEVMNIAGEAIEQAPSFGAKMNTSYILGMAKTDGGVKILLDIDKVLSGNEIMSLEKVSK